MCMDHIQRGVGWSFEDIRANVWRRKRPFVDFPIQTWCILFFDTVCMNNMVEKNLIESFKSWILEARNKLIIGMLEDKNQSYDQVVENEVELMTWNCDWSPTTIKMYNKFLKIGNVCELNFNGDMR